MPEATELIEHQTITAICDNVEQAKLEVKQAFESLRAAKARLKATLGDGTRYYHTILPHRNYYGDNIFEEREEKETYDNITRNAWRYILEQTGLRQFMTEKRQKELESQIDSNNLPPLTVENIVGTLQGLAGRVDGLLKESVKEVFDWLRPRGAWGNGKLKTNHKFHVGPKAIVYGVESNYSHGFRIRYNYDANFRSLGNAFSLLDGRGVQKYPNDLSTRFNEAFKLAVSGETFADEYFEIKCYINGNAHIKFKRLDLLKEMNRIGGEDGGLPEH